MRSTRLLLAALGLSAPLAGCQPGDFQDLADHAPVVVIHTSDPYPSGTFGSLLHAYRADFPDGVGGTIAVSRLAIGTGLLQLSPSQVDGVIGSYSGWKGISLDVGRKIFARCAGTTGGCPPDTGASLVGLPAIGGELGCVLSGAPGDFAGATGSYLVATCETSRSVFVVAGSEPNDGLGRSLAAFPGATSYGVAVAGAPLRGTSGAIVVVPDSLVPDPLVPPTEISQESLGLPAAVGNLGEALAATSLPASQTLTTLGSPTVVAAATSGTTGTARIVVFALGTRDVGGVPSTEAEPLGCLDLDGTMGEGTVLALGDVTGDDLPELVVGADAGVPNRSSQVRILSLATLVGAPGGRVGCTSPDASDDPSTTLLACVDGSGGSSLSCADSGFGAALAIGDANGDGKGDLLVGAPYSLVAEKANAGAAYLYPGGTSLGEPVVLTDSAPLTNDTLGIAVTFLPSQIGPGQAPRAEPVAGAPGHGAVLVFLCSGLEGDAPTGDAARCIVQN